MSRPALAFNGLLFWTLFTVGAEAAPPKGDSVSYDITVTDEAGVALEGATVWMMGDTLARTDLRAADLARLVARYGRDVDLVFNGDLHPSLQVSWANATGQLNIMIFDYDVGGMKRVRNHFAAFKRGYLPTQISDEAPINSVRKLQIRLVPDPAAKIDPRMRELDRIHAKARELASRPVNFELSASLKTVNAELRKLAADLESSGLADEAAAAYEILANLPSVDTGKDSQGSPIIIGVTNRFRADDPRRAADREQAAKLQRSYPMLEFHQMWVNLARRDVDPMAMGNAPLRTQYVQQTRALLDKHGDRLWPETRYYLWQALIREKDYSAACDMLRSFQQSEPSYFNRTRWQKLSNQYRNDVRAVGGPGDARCELALPKN